MNAIMKNLKRDDSRAIMYCPLCEAEFSANASDYWYLPLDYTFLCECGGEMRLVTKHVVYQPVK